jgi:hypothetical protein
VKLRFSALIFLAMMAPAAMAQTATLVNSTPQRMPSSVDSNSPAYWLNGRYFLINSVEKPRISWGTSQFDIEGSADIEVDSRAHFPMWIEAAWADDDGTVYAWYHHEPGDVCTGNKLTSPKIGALVSRDEGRSFTDLGIVLEAGDAPDCDAKNGFFASGHGDFSVVPDRERRYFYFYYGNYGGPVAQQGVAVARMRFEDRAEPVGKVVKFWDDRWEEPGLGGRQTPVFGALTRWQDEDTNSYWGPSLHWNTFLERWVMLMTLSCCRSKWPMAGVYVSFTPDLSDPRSWTLPEAVMGPYPNYYPQVLGLAPGETDKEAGAVARFYLQGKSEWELVFTKEDPVTEDPLMMMRVVKRSIDR